MPLPAFVEATLQATIMSVISNVVAQYIESLKREDAKFEINYIPVFQFIIFTMVVTPPNFFWQLLLEKVFPAREKPPHPKKSDDPPPKAKLSVRNTVIKLLLDQTVGATVNTLAFSVFNRSIQIAMAHVPPVYSFFKAIKYWQSPGAIDFAIVDWDAVWAMSKDEFWPIIQAGWMLWPAVSLFNFTMVETIQARNAIGGVAGIAWGVYMSMVAAE